MYHDFIVNSAESTGPVNIFNYIFCCSSQASSRGQGGHCILRHTSDLGKHNKDFKVPFIELLMSVNTIVISGLDCVFFFN